MAEEYPDEEIEEFSADSMDDATKAQNPDILLEPEKPTIDNLDLYICSRIIDTWKAQHESDIMLRRQYARYLVIILCIETAIMFIAFLGIGLQRLTYTERTVQLFLVLSIGQIMGAIFVMVKYLFSKDSHVILRDIAAVLSQIHKSDNGSHSEFPNK